MKRNKFSLSNYKALTTKQGTLTPIGIQEVIPGDTFQQSTSALLRCTPLNTPVMHPVTVRIHHWFVPYRLIWDNFQNFITGGEDGNDATAYPYVTAGGGGFAVGSLADYLGVPTGIASLQVSALPFRAYQLIFREWYRDQDLVSAPTISKGDGSDATTDVGIKSIAWEKDYFTSSRPWTQKGPSVTLPLGTTAPVQSTGVAPTFTNSNGALTNENLDVVAGSGYTDNPQAVFSGAALGGSGKTPVHFGNVTGLETNLSSASAVTINALRNALALQRFEEWRARFGSRYTEYLRSLGVKSSDARLQRPEYLAGGKQTIQFSEVIQTGVNTSGTPLTGLGTMAGHGIAAMRSNRYRRYFEEHGIVMTLLSVRPKTVYATGLFRMWNRRTKFDFWQPQLEHIGQQTVLNKEVDAAHGTLDGTFGFQDRYDEYRRAESSVSGLFRPGQIYATWNMARDFSGLPALNASFVNCTPTTRVFQDTANDHLLIMVNHSIQARRMLSQKANPFTF